MNAHRRRRTALIRWLGSVLLAPALASAAVPLTADPSSGTASNPESSKAAPAVPPSPPPPVIVYEAPHGHQGWWGDSPYRSSGMAFALSMTPLPVDFGNLYAENVSWGIGYTSVELALGTGAMWLGANHMCHWRNCDEWSSGERAAMISLVSAYVVVKLAAGIHASIAAEHFNRAQLPAMHPVVAPAAGGAVFGWRATF